MKQLLILISLTVMLISCSTPDKNSQADGDPTHTQDENNTHSHEDGQEHSHDEDDHHHEQEEFEVNDSTAHVHDNVPGHP
ncbi:MAG: hypothetical protein OER04_00145 [Cyclobacteriaceae bacterium]|nr:hypothetical protein [Cyclobacteriaceae bacterium]